MKHYEHLQDLAAMLGQEVGVSDWVLVDQARIQRFADATGDHQWIHLDAERAAAGPFGQTIAHGYLTLSLLPLLFSSAFKVLDVRMGVNYGLNKVRFPAPVPVNSRVRGRFVLAAFDVLPGGAQLSLDATLERDDSSKPVCVAQTVSRLFV